LTDILKNVALEERAGFQPEINDVDFSAITIKDKHVGFFIFTGDKIFVWSRQAR
jgi:hypothetical protein